MMSRDFIMSSSGAETDRQDARLVWRLRPGATSVSAEPEIFGRFWLANVAAWCLLAMLTMFLRQIFFANVSTTLVMTAVLEPAGFAYTCLLHLVIYRHIIGGRQSLAMMAIASVALSLLGGLGQTLLANVVLENTGGLPREGYDTALMAPFLYTPIFVGWSIGYFLIAARLAVDSERQRRQDAETAALQAELRFLQNQLDPHFLFNALNTITSEIPDRPEVALEMTRAVSSYLRAGLEGESEEPSTVETEIGHVTDYLRIQELRFEDRLHCTIDVSDEALGVRVPRLLLQGLVENAIKHGRQDRTGRLRIKLDGRMAGDVLSVTVSNSGHYAPNGRDNPGLGIENTRRRLAIAYPKRHEMTVTQRDGEVVVRITLKGAPCFG